MQLLRAVPRATGIFDRYTRRLNPPRPSSLQACPRGAVGVGGVDLTPLSPGGGQEKAGADAEASHRFSCVGAELPMLMRRDGAARVHEVWWIELVELFRFCLALGSTHETAMYEPVTCEHRLDLYIATFRAGSLHLGGGGGGGGCCGRNAYCYGTPLRAIYSCFSACSTVSLAYSPWKDA